MKLNHLVNKKNNVNTHKIVLTLVYSVSTSIKHKILHHNTTYKIIKCIASVYSSVEFRAALVSTSYRYCERCYEGGKAVLSWSTAL